MHHELKTLTPEYIKNHFPKTPDEARIFKPIIQRHALAGRVLAVAKTRIEGAWNAYVDAVPGMNHRSEQSEVLQHGAKLPEYIAQVLFPLFSDIPYAR